MSLNPRMWSVCLVFPILKIYKRDIETMHPVQTQPDHFMNVRMISLSLSQSEVSSADADWWSS